MSVCAQKCAEELAGTKDGPQGTATFDLTHGAGLSWHVGVFWATDVTESLFTIDRAVELARDFLNTADQYGLRWNERHFGKPLEGRTSSKSGPPLRRLN